MIFLAVILSLGFASAAFIVGVGVGAMSQKKNDEERRQFELDNTYSNNVKTAPGNLEA